MDYLEEIFLKAREISDPNDRASYLWDACCGDTSFLKRVQEMLCVPTAWVASLRSETSRYRRWLQ